MQPLFTLFKINDCLNSGRLTFSTMGFPGSSESPVSSCSSIQLDLGKDADLPLVLWWYIGFKFPQPATSRDLGDTHFEHDEMML